MVERYKLSRRSETDRVYEIDVYWHAVVRDGVGNTEADARASIAVLNDAFVGHFTFVLKKTIMTSPTGNWDITSGSDHNLKSARRGDCSTLNVYSTSLKYGVLGYSNYPTTCANRMERDGVVILYGTVPGGNVNRYNEGDTLTHEVGHWLYLQHTFSNTDGLGCNGKGDGVDDTPAISTANYGCPIGRDSCPRQPGDDMITNFMDYTYDSCMDRFTPGQFVRMRAAWETYRMSEGDTIAPTTALPTTALPTTPSPTTSSPTAPPTTFSPTTALPTTASPTASPTTSSPTTASPTAPPTTLSPTAAPTTVRPTTAPPTTASPTASPTTASPTTASPTASPITSSPIATPTTVSPTTVSLTTASPTTPPTTASPTTFPTAPTALPTARPKVITQPTASPTAPPAATSTESPTAHPTTASPTSRPTNLPSATPTVQPTDSPTATSTVQPTDSPTLTPTVQPTDSPTATSTVQPTDSPTATPTVQPTDLPSATPIVQPTGSPTVTPTAQPTDLPSVTPSTQSSTTPTKTRVCNFNTQNECLAKGCTWTPDKARKCKPCGATNNARSCTTKGCVWQVAKGKKPSVCTPCSEQKKKECVKAECVLQEITFKSGKEGIACRSCAVYFGLPKKCRNANCAYDKLNKRCMPCATIEKRKVCNLMKRCSWGTEKKGKKAKCRQLT